MIIAAIVVLIFMASLWVLGRAAIFALSKEVESWLSLPVGLSLAGLLANLLYFGMNLPFYVIKCIYGVVVIICLVVLLRKNIERLDISTLIGPSCVFLILSIPAYVGGVQYWVFRGNHWDHFNYIDQALTLALHPVGIYRSHEISYFFSQNVILHGIPFLNLRPAVGLVFALLLPFGHGDIHLFAFLFVTMLWAFAFPGMVYGWIKLRGIDSQFLGLRRIFAWVAPLSFCVGFWGQYIFDINAWSEMASIPIQVSFAFLYIDLINRAKSLVVRRGWGPEALAAILCAGGFAFYPEDWIIQSFLIGVVTLAIFTIYRWNFDRKRLFGLMVFLVIGIIFVMLPDWRVTSEFILNQVRFGGQNTPEGWATYFDSYWHGQCVNLNAVQVFANFIVSFIGLYFLTPTCLGESIFLTLWQWATIALALLILVKVIRVIVNVILRPKEATWPEMFLLFSIPIFLYLWSRGAVWSLGKVLTYVSPFLFFALCSDLLAPRSTLVQAKHLGSKVATWAGYLLAIVFVLAQFEFAGARVEKAGNTLGIGYDPQFYPSIQNPSLKTETDWSIPIDYFSGCKGIYISNVNDPFVLEYLTQKLEYRKIPYFFKSGLTDHFGNGSVLGYQQPIPYDCTLTQRRDSMGKERIMSTSQRQGGTILFAQRPPTSTYLGIGAPEPWGSWTVGSRSSISFDHLLPNAFTLELRVYSVFGPNAGKLFHIAVGDQGHDVRIDSAGIYRLSFTDVALSNEIDIVTPSPTSPKSLGISGDERALGLGLVSVAILPVKN